MVTVGNNILIICNFVTLLIQIISVICDLSHRSSQVTSAKKMHTDVSNFSEETNAFL